MKDLKEAIIDILRGGSSDIDMPNGSFTMLDENEFPYIADTILTATESQPPVWIPIDPNNLPEGEVLATDGVGVIYGLMCTHPVHVLPICDAKAFSLYNITHYMIVTPPKTTNT